MSCSVNISFLSAIHSVEYISSEVSFNGCHNVQNDTEKLRIIFIFLLIYSSYKVDSD